MTQVATMVRSTDDGFSDRLSRASMASMLSVDGDSISDSIDLIDHPPFNKEGSDADDLASVSAATSSRDGGKEESS
jgi:hypothetical protein